MGSRDDINRLSLELIRDPRNGPQALAAAGRAVLTFAARTPKREALGIDYTPGTDTSSPIVAWSRDFRYDTYGFAVSRWRSDDSFALLRRREPPEGMPAVVRGYIFGNDESVKGLRAANPLTVIPPPPHSSDSVPEVELLMQPHNLRPVRKSLTLTQINPFCRGLKSILEEPR